MMKAIIVIEMDVPENEEEHFPTYLREAITTIREAGLQHVRERLHVAIDTTANKVLAYISEPARH